MSVQMRVAQQTVMDLSRYAQCCVIQFLCVEGARQADVVSQMKPVHSDNCSVQQWLNGARGSKGAEAALKTWHAPVIHATL